MTLRFAVANGSLGFGNVTQSVITITLLIFQSIIALIMIIPDASSFSTLIDYFTFASWIFYGLTFLSVIVLRFRRPDWERPFKVKFYIQCNSVVVELTVNMKCFYKNLDCMIQQRLPLHSGKAWTSEVFGSIYSMS